MESASPSHLKVSQYRACKCLRVEIILCGDRRESDTLIPVYKDSQIIHSVVS